MLKRTRKRYETRISNLERANMRLTEQVEACLRRLEDMGYNIKPVCCPLCGSKDLSSCMGGEYYRCRECDTYIAYDASLDQYLVKCGRLGWFVAINRHLEHAEELFKKVKTR